MKPAAVALMASTLSVLVSIALMIIESDGIAVVERYCRIKSANETSF